MAYWPNSLRSLFRLDLRSSEYCRSMQGLFRDADSESQITESGVANCEFLASSRPFSKQELSKIE